MNKHELVEYLHSVYPELSIDMGYMRGYSHDEIKQIERLYDIKVTGQFYDFLSIMGRCSGGLFGDDPLTFYRTQMTTRNRVLSQYLFSEEVLEGINRRDLIKQKPFCIAIESHTQYLFVLTDSDTPNMVYNYNENEEIIEETNRDLNAYLRHLVYAYTRNYEVKAPFDRCGELLII